MRKLITDEIKEKIRKTIDAKVGTPEGQAALKRMNDQLMVFKLMCPDRSPEDIKKLLAEPQGEPPEVLEELLFAQDYMFEKGFLKL